MVKDRDAWHVAVHGGHKESDTIERLNDNNMQLNIRKQTAQSKMGRRPEQTFLQRRHKDS